MSQQKDSELVPLWTKAPLPSPGDNGNPRNPQNPRPRKRGKAGEGEGAAGISAAEREALTRPIVHVTGPSLRWALAFILLGFLLGFVLRGRVG